MTVQKEDTDKKRRSTSETELSPSKATKTRETSKQKLQKPPAKQQRIDVGAAGDSQLAENMFDLSQSVFPPAPSPLKHSSSAAVRDDGKVFMPDILPATSSESVWSKRVVATSLKVGFLGLGTMGSAIVNNLLKSGHDVTVWNRTVSKCRDLVRFGAERGNTPSEVVQACDITFSCVSDPTALKDLVFGNSGVLQGIGSGKSYVDMSTVDVETMADVYEAVTARGGRFLEAPIVGNKQSAISGQLIILAAGDLAVYEDCASCFEAIGRRTFFLGSMGFATKMKLVVSMLVGTTLAGLSESLALSTKLGLNVTDVLEVLRHSSANSQFIREKGRDIATSKFSDGGCKLSLLQKDLKLAINMSDAVDQPLHVSSAVNELYKKAKAKGYGEHDIAAVYRAANL